jgi:hypothetical protein
MPGLVISYCDSPIFANAKFLAVVDRKRGENIIVINGMCWVAIALTTPPGL